MKTLPCKICGRLYTDRIDPRVDFKKGGYIVCPRCLMGKADAYSEKAKQIEIDPGKLINSIKSNKLVQFRKSLKLTQDDLAERLGLKRRQYIKIEKCQYIPSVKTLRKFEKQFLNATLRAS